MWRFLLAGVCAVLAVSLSGCTSHSTTIDPGNGIVVDITNVFPNDLVQVTTPPVVLNATVANDPTQRGVKWSLTTANVPCSPGCGTLVPSHSPSFSATYTPPMNAPLNQQATIQATAVADNQQNFTFIFTILPLASVQITNKFTSVLNGAAPIQVNAAVKDDLQNAGVTWSLTLNGSNCSPACGTLAASAAPSFAALYTPPANYPGSANANPTITATSVTNPQASDSFNFTIVSSDTLFTGTYAFLLRGYDGNQLPMSMAGVLVSDGNGNLTNVELDINDDGGLNHLTGQSGTYAVQVTSTGVLQVLAEVSSYVFPGSVDDIKFRFFLSKDATRGRMIELDGSGYINSGTIEQQNTSVAATAPSGNFAFGVDSDAPFGARTIAAGQLQLAIGGVAGGLIDQSFQANLSPVFVAAPISADTMSAPDALGRGTLNVTVQGQTVQYAYYIVDSNRFNLIEADRGLIFGTVFAGHAHSQAALTANSVNGISVIQGTGFDVPAGTNNVLPVVLIGQLTTSGNTYQLAFIENLCGPACAITTSLGSPIVKGTVPGALSFDPTTGRAVISAPGGFSSGFVNQVAWYLYDQCAGYFVEEDFSTSIAPPVQSITNRAISGTSLPQAPLPFQPTDVLGNMIVGFGASSSPLIPNAEIALTASTGSNPNTPTYTAVGDLTSEPSQAGNVPNISFTGVMKLSNAGSGIAGATFPAPFFADFNEPTGASYSATFYMIAPNQMVGIGVSVSAPISGIIFIDPQ